MHEKNTPHRPEAGLPLLGLLALAAAGFITVLTEAMPAGLLPQIGASLGVTPALVGQLVTVYAIGSLVAAIPLVAFTRSWRRRPLLLLAIGGFAIVNTVTALSHGYALTLVARFFAGVFAGLLWALLAGQAARMVAPSMQGRAIAVAMLGAPLALSLGIPAGTLLGNGVGWRPAFLIMSALSVLLLGWVRWQVPDFPGQAAGRQQGVRRVFLLPGVRPVLAVMLAFVLAHNILYTYIAPFLAHAGLGARVDLVLLVFGGASLAGIWVTGVLIDRWLRELVLAGTAAFAVAALLLGALTGSQPVVFVAVAVWGVAFGGAATLFQTASAQAAGDAADVAQSMVVTAWNIAIAGGGLIGGLLLQSRGAGALPWSLIVLLVPALWLAWKACAHGFPRTRAVTTATAH
ncbi:MULTISPECIES: MFS transporter [unclassified Variovorax]|uniref:MFS transporter n=1 Tax=unclassified Variovorax TaxID=663243 RepID=UPI0008AE0281|nr:MULTISPECIES: MFS transporter [unclassified Variovorax]SEK01373.1 Predicted arabinose efflux permease, MFS family [Variovorax sp. OK202]SFD31264.1 Predicted arabinose efflux permease, MFS family [Variovorax sp. OK212]